MKAFVKRVLLFLLIFFFVEKAFVFYRNLLPDRELDKRLELILNGKLNSEVIILGSSRGARDIIASQLTDSLEASVYNLSYPGSDIRFHEYILRALLSYGNKKPDLVLLAVDDPSEFVNDPTLQFRYDRLYPLVKYKAVRDTLIARGQKNRVLSQLFIVHQLSAGDFDLKRKKFNAQDTIYNDGSMPISWQSKKFNEEFIDRVAIYDRNMEDAEKVQSFRNVIRTCMENDIRLVLICPPNFSKPTVGFTERLVEIGGADIPVMQYDTTNAVYTNRNFYFDPGHLRLNGARIFTSEITAFIKRSDILDNRQYVSSSD